MRLRKDARRFLSRHREALNGLPVSVCGVGSTNDTEKESAGAREHLDRALRKHAWLKPAASKVFGGKLDPKSLRFPHSVPE